MAKKATRTNLTKFFTYNENVTWCFQLAENILVTFAIFATFADFSGPFLAWSLSKS